MSAFCKTHLVLPNSEKEKWLFPKETKKIYTKRFSHDCINEFIPSVYA